MHKSNSLLELVKFYNRESGKMSLVHHSIFLSKCATLIKRQEHDKDDLEEAEKFMRKSASKLFDHHQELDIHSVAMSLKVISYYQFSNKDYKFKPK